MIFNDIHYLWLGGRKGLMENYLALWERVSRKGKDDFLNWLKYTDFFSAPASANNHNNYACGLVEHHLNVYYNLLSLVASSGTFVPPESLIITALTHDICKINFYLESTRNNKVDGVWIKEPFFSIEDRFPLGHGEKSVIILQKFMELTDPEIMAIRWHMVGFDDSARSFSGGLALTKAMQTYPLITLLHAADLFACLPETEGQL